MSTPSPTSRLAKAVAVLALAEVLLVLLSWFLSATQVGEVRSLLSSEGIRWFFAHFVDWLGRPLLVWIVLLSMAAGVLRRSGLLSRRPVGRRRLALRVTLMVAVAYIAILLLLTALPHALLLSAMGSLCHSPFSRAFVALVAFGIVICCMAYGFASRTFTSFADVCQSMVDGLNKSAPLVVVYVFAMQFYESLCYVFSFGHAI